MRILIVAATDPEVAPILERMYSTPTADTCVDTYTHGAHDDRRADHRRRHGRDRGLVLARADARRPTISR